MNNSPLSVLIVEDNPIKKQKLFAHLQSKPDIFLEPVVAICVNDATKLMQDKCYDLLILDISIPNQAVGDPSEDNSIALLRRIDGGVGGIKPPRFVLPISAIASLTKATLDFFRCRPWGIIPYDEQTSQSLLDIESIASWILNQKVNEEKGDRCDIFIMTALEDPEFAAIESEQFNWGPLQPLDEKQLVKFSELEFSGRKLKIGAGFCQRMGPVSAAILTSKAINSLKPKLIIMAGICAGASDKVSLGDLIAAEEAWDWQSGKFVDDDGSEGFQATPHQLGFHSSLRNLLMQLKQDEAYWQGFDETARLLSLARPKLVLGPMATGASVVADARIIDRIKRHQHKNVIGLDMETYAVHAAVEAAPINVKAISLKAVCDKGDKEKKDTYQKYAAKVSAAFVMKFILTYGDKFIAE